jgi:CheY-like chemotaxis protein
MVKVHGAIVHGVANGNRGAAAKPAFCLGRGGAGAATGSGMARVLLVDDDSDVLDSLRAWLMREHEVRVAGGFPEAMAALVDGPVPDVVITDYDMPPFHGDDLLAVIAARFPTVCRILYTGSADGLVADCRVAHHVILKGGDPRMLNTLIHAWRFRH